MEIHPAIVLNGNRHRGCGCGGCFTGIFKIIFVTIVVVIVIAVVL
jgi:hypothetical protein